MTASPSAHFAVPIVFPVAANRDLPSVLRPPGAQIPPPRARVVQLETLRGFDSEIPTTIP